MINRSAVVMITARKHIQLSDDLCS